MFRGFGEPEFASEGIEMQVKEVVIDAKLEFEVEAEHDVIAVSKALVWLCDALAKDKNAPLKKVGFNLGTKQE